MIKKLLVTTAIAGVLITPVQARYYGNGLGIFGAIVGGMIGMGMAMRPPAYYPPYRPYYQPPPVYQPPAYQPPAYQAPPAYQNGQVSPGNGQPYVLHLLCDRPVVLVGGGGPDPNPVVGVEVSYSEDHVWQIFHHFQQGGVVSRSAQYSMIDMTGNNAIQWKGTQLRDPTRTMIGELRAEGNGVFYYEWAYWNGQLQMNSKAQCFLNGPPPAVASTTPPASPANVPPNPPPVVTADPPAKDSVPLFTDGTAIAIYTVLGGIRAPMIVDTGAATMQITEEIANKIIANGRGRWEQSGHFRMADGHETTQPMMTIDDVVIGNHVVRNVEATVTKNGNPLMSFSVLNSIAPFTIDTTHNELVFNSK